MAKGVGRSGSAHMAGLAPGCRRAAALALAVGLGLGPQTAAAQPRNPQRMEPPKWLEDDGKDLFNDLENEENLFGDSACETREKLLKYMAGKGAADAADHRARVLLSLGICEFRKGDYERSKRRLDSAVSELNLPSEELLLTNPNLAPIGTMRQAAEFMTKHELTQAGTALRRCREVLDRNLRKVIKLIHKQMSAQAPVPPVEKLLEEIPGFGKSGQFLPMIRNQVPSLKQDLLWSEMIENSLDTLDKRLMGFDASQKGKRDRLDVSKAKSKGGSLLYVRALASEAVATGDRLAAAQELVREGVAKALVEEATPLDKAVSLVKRGKEGPGCKDDTGLPKTCKALLKVADVRSNGFGETRVLIVKAGKKQPLETCSTNANLGILIAAKGGARLSVAGTDGPTELPAGEPVVFDFCREASIEADAQTPVLFAQAWHPEFAALERTTEIRARSETWGFSEDDVKAAAQVVNDNAKANWDKSAEQWRKGSAALAGLRQSLRDEIDNRRRLEEAAAEAKRSDEVANDEDRQRALEALEKKREARRNAQEQAEEARKLRKKQLEEERAMRDPWLNSPEVREAERRLEGMKESRRDANSKLEFDLSTQLTKDIALAERQLQRTIKLARKAHLSGGTLGGDKAAAAQEGEGEKPAEAGPANPELEKLRKRLQEVKAEKAKASEAENFKEAKRLKLVQQELEGQLQKLEL